MSYYDTFFSIVRMFVLHQTSNFHMPFTNYLLSFFNHMHTDCASADKKRGPFHRYLYIPVHGQHQEYDPRCQNNSLSLPDSRLPVYLHSRIM